MRLPPLRPEQIEPRDSKISTPDAKKIFRQYMLQTKYLAKDEVAEHANYFAEEMRSEESFLRDEASRAKQDYGPYITETKADIRKIERDLAKATQAAAKAELQAELDDANLELAEQMRCVSKADEEYKAFKEDKRAFLVAYINRQTQR